MTVKKISVISAVYNVDRYLDQYLKSLDQQTLDHSKFQVILVNDGSTDASRNTLERWSETTDISLTIIDKQNGGQSSARNMGIRVAEGEWVTFADPDDVLAPGYLSNVVKFAEDHEAVELIIGHLFNYYDDVETVRDNHPLAYRYRGGDQVVDIDRFPDHIHLHAASAFFRRAQLVENGTLFDEKIQPTFEDAHFTQVYLLNARRRLMGVVASASYYYRRRSDQSSTLQRSVSDPRRYTDVLRYGCLDLLERAGSNPPMWLRYVILYELTWSLKAEEAISSGSSGLPLATVREFHKFVKIIVDRIGHVAIDSFAIVRRTNAQREALLHGYSDVSWRWDGVVINDLDPARGLVELRYRYTGDRPSEEFFVRGRRVIPVAHKTRHFIFFRRTLIKERVIWLPSSGTLRASIGDEAASLKLSWPSPPVYSVRPAAIENKIARKPNPVVRRSQKPRSLRRSKMVSFATRKVSTRLFRNAWLLMDRDNDGNDNAEHLFRYLRSKRRDINAWFVVRRGTKTWDRLRSSGYKRLVAYGSALWRILVASCDYLISSHADAYVHLPKDTRMPWKPHFDFVFLQHGVTKDDISRWLNGKRIAAICASTTPEFWSIAGDGSPYKFSTKDTFLTGMPRFDRLERLASVIEGAGRDVILFAPTWRLHLGNRRVSNGGARAATAEFVESGFWTAWSELLTSHVLREVAQSSGHRIVLVLHPNIAQNLSSVSLPDYISVATYDGDDIQTLLARSRILVTDYSSLAFDAALIRRRVVYFQFDRHEVFSGAHTTRPGYFSYDQHGFGPALTDVDDVLREVVDSVTSTTPTHPYGDRIDSTFTLPAGGACRRVVETIESLSEPVSPRGPRHPVDVQSAPAIRYFDE